MNRNISRQVAEGSPKKDVYLQFKAKMPDESLRYQLGVLATPAQKKQRRYLFAFIRAFWILFLLLELPLIFDIVEATGLVSLAKSVVSLAITCFLAWSVFRGRAYGFSGGMLWLLIDAIWKVRLAVVLGNESSGLNDGEVLAFRVLIACFLFLEILAIGVMKQIKQIWFPYYGFTGPRRNHLSEAIYDAEEYYKQSTQKTSPSFPR